MHLLELTCDGFRGLEPTVYRPARGVNVIRGCNAQGKTSLLEAVLFLATSRSHRTRVETELVRRGAEGFRLATQIQCRDRVAHVEAAWHQGVKRFKVNGVAQTRMSDVLGHLQVVLFSPEDVELVSGTAAVRRRFLDMALSPLDPLYLDALQQYRQVLRQRNEVIRSDQPGTALLDAWDQQLARYGGTLSQRRARFLGDLAARAALVHQQIAPEETVAIEYKPDIRYDEDLLDVLQRSRPHDIRRGATSRGPHRDDFAIVIGAGPARSFASQGQQRTLTLAVKLALVQVVRDAVGEVPVLMLDEVFSELDEQRSRRLIDTIDPDVQCLLTTTDLTRSWWDNGVVSAEFLMERGRLEKR